jgi:hypothetical protein
LNLRIALTNRRCSFPDHLRLPGRKRKSIIMKTKYFHPVLILLVICSSLVLPGVVQTAQAAEGQIDLTISVESNCADMQFNIDWPESSPPYLLYFDFGDGDTTEILQLEQAGISLSHTYPDQGEYSWSAVLVEAAPGGGDGFASGVVHLDGPRVEISSQPFPAVITVEKDDSLVSFTSQVNGGSEPYTYTWDLDSDGQYDDGTGPTASYQYSAPGEYHPRLLVTDSCGFSGSDTIPVVTADEEELCHPTAEKIATAVNNLRTEQSTQVYSCQDIYDYFDGNQESQIGFGRMWKAYQLALSREEMSWEDLLDWHLAGRGWGVLIQLDRYAELLEDHNLSELAGLAVSDDYTLRDVRSAARMAARYGAEFGDALDRSAGGSNPGELARFYQLAQDLDTDPALLEAYLLEGMTLVELEQAARAAEKTGASWTDVAEARRSAENWGEVQQALRMATDEISAADILAVGLKTYRINQRKAKQAEQEAARNQHTAEQLAGQFDLPIDEIMLIFEGECQGSWQCVRAVLRDTEQDQDQDKNTPPGQDKDKDTPPGQDKDKQTPPGQDKDKQTPPGQDNDKQTPPGQDKDKNTPPGQDKDKDTPPGQDKDKDKKK